MDGSIFAYVAAGVAGLGLLSWRFQNVATTFGSSAWLSIFEAYRAGLFKSGGLLVGDWTGLLPVRYDAVHAITFGAAGSGKGTTVIIPNLLSQRFIFLNDPGGENTAVAIRQWRKRGFEISIINPFGKHKDAPWQLPSHSFNPFDFLDPASETFSADAKVLATLLVPRAAHEHGASKYFTDRAEGFIHAAIVHILTTMPPERQHPGTLYDITHLDAPDWEDLLNDMKANQAERGLVHAAAVVMERMETQSPGEFSGVMGTVQQNLQWLAESKTQATVSGSEVDFAALKGVQGEKGAVVAVVLPVEYKESHRAIPRLAMQCAVWTMLRAPHARRKVLFEIDETASLGRIESLPQWLAELRKYRVQWSLHFQNVGQARFLYEREWQTFHGNADLKRYVGVSDYETAVEASHYAGRATIAVQSKGARGNITISETARELILPDEVIRLRRDLMIALFENSRPAILKKTPYWQRPEFAGRYHPNPYFGGKKRASPIASLKEMWGRLAYLAAWWLTPDPAALLLWFTLALMPVAKSYDVIDWVAKALTLTGS